MKTYPGHEGHVIGVLYNECTDHEPTEPEDDADNAALDAYDQAMEEFYAGHFAIGEDADYYGCDDTIVGDYCRTCYEASDPDSLDEPPLLVSPMQPEGQSRQEPQES